MQTLRLPPFTHGPTMSGKTSLLDSILVTPASGASPVTVSIRSSLLSTLFDNLRPLVMSGVASGFVALVALSRTHRGWAALWLGAEIVLLAARLGIAWAYLARNRAERVHPGRWARRYAPVSLLACLALGTGSMACVVTGDTELASLAVMVTAGILGGIASRNAALPRLAILQITLGVLPIGVGALLTPIHGMWILVPPLLLYLIAMTSVVRRHYKVLVALMAAEQKHAELAARFDAALAHMPHGLCTIDESGKVVIANRRAAELFGATIEMLKLNVPLPEFIGQVGLARFGETFRAELIERCTTWLADNHGPLDLELDDGRQLEMTRNPVPDGSSVIIIEDVTQRRESEAKILHWARHDPLTGLPNRRYLYDQLEWSLAHRASGYLPPLAVMYLDLDGFKQVNDALGHHAGDLVLGMVAERLRRTLRDNEWVARLGGDEFAFVIEHVEQPGVAALATRAIAQLSEPYALPTGVAAKIGASVGIAFAERDDTFETLIRRADAALYEAKGAGRGTFRFAPAGAGLQTRGAD